MDFEVTFGRSRNRVHMHPLLSGVLAAAVPFLSGSSLQAGHLSFEQRVAAQRAIEQVYWNHRIWPKENRRFKPPLSAVLSDDAIAARVEDYLAKSKALEEIWQRPITASELQAEIDRMALHSRSPKVLDELFAALGDDPRLIAETLARQTLADRLIRNRYAHDARFHAALKKRVEGGLAACASAGCIASLGGEYSETIWKLRGEPEQGLQGEPREDTVYLDAREWRTHLTRLAGILDGEPDALPLSKTGGVGETPEAFVITAVLSQSRDEVRTATATWSKRSFDDWWDAARATLSTLVQESSGPFTLPATRTFTCTPDTWTPTEPSYARDGHTAVWTGSEMIVWGGINADYLNIGGRYDPATDSWTPTSTGANVPAARFRHTAVWSGTEMIVWGGVGDGFVPTNTGGRYDPTTDTWSPTSTGANVPDARSGHTAVWTGTEMIVWGGADAGFSLTGTGGRYDPVTDSWAPTSTGDFVPAARFGHTAVWTGSEMIVWGGVGGPLTNTGGRYDPAADSWTPTSTGAGVPDARSRHTAVWTGTEMIVWGGVGDGSSSTNTGGRYDPAADSWSPTSTGANVPAARFGHTAVWSGTVMIVWGGVAGGPFTKTGARYDPGTNSWTPTSTGASVPDARIAHTAVWTGTEMIVWGGSYLSSVMDTGGRYDPVANTWAPTSTGTLVPAARRGHTAVWTGTEMIVWGGGRNTGGRYDPATDSWTPTSTGANVPDARNGHTAVWTGTEMIVWGGYGGLGLGYLNSGGRYDPATDSWSPTSTGTGVPDPREYHSSVWSGREMIVWGGRVFGSGHFNTGGRYEPVTDSWTSTSTGANVPDARYLHSAVWTGTEMIVWGGLDGDVSQSNTGGRYDPVTDSWTPTSTGANVPNARYGHTAFWTGTEIIIWGGAGVYCSDPCDNTWYVVSENTGGRYEPATDLWTPTSTGIDVPTARYGHSAVWTGTEMIVWGGAPSSGVAQQSGGLYCACPSHRDADGDGFGDPTVVLSACDGTMPAGYVTNSADCDDADASIHPDAVELPGNTEDENCDGSLACDPAAAWPNHGQYVRCVAQTCNQLVGAGLVDRHQCDDLTSRAAGSAVDKSRHVGGTERSEAAGKDPFAAEEPADTSADDRAVGVPDECAAEVSFPSAELLAADAAAGDWFGYSVSIDGATAVVGAPGGGDAGTASGAAYVFVRSGTSWIQQAKLTAADAAPYDEFGYSVAVDDDSVVVGALNNDFTGSAYVFVRSGTSWVQQAKLTADDADAVGEFGASVSIDGDTALVGAYGPCPWTCPGPGAAYVFVRSGSTWVQQAKLTASDGAAGDLFGNSVSIDGESAVVGASHADGAGYNSGSAYVFVRTGTSWAQQAKLIAADTAAGDFFGYSVSIDRDSLIVGAILDDDGAADSGSAYVFVRTGTSWAQQAKLTAADAVASGFGRVSIDGDSAVVGASQPSAGGRSGSAYLLVRTEASWTQLARLGAPDSGDLDLFGHSVAIDGDAIVVGAIWNDQAGTDAGSAYLFGPLADCNGNNVPDSCDIEDGSSLDENRDGVPDECQVTPVLVDIKPGSCPSALNVNSKGVLPVAVLGTTEFDVEAIDITSVRLRRADGVGGQVAPSEGRPGPKSSYEDVATPFDGQPCDCHELGGDAITDLSLHFETVDVVDMLALDDLPRGAQVELIVSGSLLDGMPFSGGDCIWLLARP